MRTTNIVLFSSGESERSGLLKQVTEALTAHGYCCAYWRDLFENARDHNNIALLPMLIKKIPSFDFAVLICEGHDMTRMLRGGHTDTVPTMRDNVLFEIGLCVMALGLEHTILLTDSRVHMPDDLTGYYGRLAVKRILCDSDKPNGQQAAAAEVTDHIARVQAAAGEIDRYIVKNAGTVSPVVVGAAASTATGYAGNFILRTLEHITEGVLIDGTAAPVQFAEKDIFLHIILPEVYNEETPRRAHDAMEPLQRGCVPNARFRRAEFRCLVKNGQLHIYDYPTTLVTSYHTARSILHMDADDTGDLAAEARFTAKELDLFEHTLRTLLQSDLADRTVKRYYTEDTPKQQEERIALLHRMLQKQVTIERNAY